MGDCEICGSTIHFASVPDGMVYPDSEIACSDCGAVHNVEADDASAWLSLVKSPAEVIAALTAERDALRALACDLTAALSQLLRLESTIEVLGEWSAADINRTMAAKNRARVDAHSASCRALLSRARAALGGAP